MFQGELAETGPVTVTDVDPKAFAEMLKYVVICFFGLSWTIACAHTERDTIYICLLCEHNIC